MRPGPSRKVQSRTATSDRPVVTSEAASVPGAPTRSRRRVTTARRLTTPMTMTAASNIQAVTKPSATASFCRLTTGNSATAVPMQARALTRSRKQPQSTRVSAPVPTM
jgi:hypothetical protein